MATLINYDLSTFRDHPKPNKRRLQELQHSEARAHAARVAYWRKKKTNLPVRAKKKSSREVNRQDTGSDASTTSMVGPKPVSDDVDVTLKLKTEHGFVYEFGLKPLPQSSRSDSVVAISQRDPTLKRVPWRSNFESGSENLVVDMKLPRHPKSNFLDPFDSVPTRQGDEVVAAMDHYIHNWGPSQRPGLKYHTKDNPLIRDVFPTALQNVELFEAAVALCLSFKAAGQNFQTGLSNSSLYHKGQALAGIRNKLNWGVVDEAVILATVFLMIIDNVFLDVQAYEAHLNGLRKMVRAHAANIQNVYGGALVAFVSWAECNALLIFGDRIALHDPALDSFKLRYPTQPFSTTVNRLISALTPGFQSIAVSGQLSVHVLAVLRNTIRWTSCIDEKYGRSSSEDEQIFLTTYDPRANSAHAMRLCRVSGEAHRVESAICKALFVYHANILNWTCRCSGYRRIVRELAETEKRTAGTANGIGSQISEFEQASTALGVRPTVAKTLLTTQQAGARVETVLGDGEAV
ncbi:uncharacterized protein Z518_04981 [Rhinocladiella mackenziei CBS 650.93]|uniref:Uncharacterized protein n=1 Tax=Rhinocladiella mackenziei CBS 650.93 TaxID=1442369 RepID=A0A0D2JD17_9EURO|nr:uncharacterized protein Z518_04981 [Rhinocladiella mackenziei CBS 650.93]KIX07005.1 hypothetical protein Z518_04981 [Rhinocladiella mackenziei CBS 650.93]